MYVYHLPYTYAHSYFSKTNWFIGIFCHLKCENIMWGDRPALTSVWTTGFKSN